MNVVFLTTFSVKCGISEYSRNLAKALMSDGLDVTIWGNIPSGKNIQDVQVASDEGFHVIRNWSVTGWSGVLLGPAAPVEVPQILHVSYESFLYPLSWFPSLLRDLHARGTEIVVTYHSAGVPQQFPREVVDLAICHTEEIEHHVPGNVKRRLSMPAPYQPPRVGTFGLGRAHVPWIIQACQELGWTFVNLIHEHGDWVPQEELIHQLQTCDVVALPYPPVGTSVSSSAAKFALSTYRPLVVSDTNWFSTIPSTLAIKHAWDYQAFKESLVRAVPVHAFVAEHSWQRAAALHKQWYAELLQK